MFVSPPSAPRFIVDCVHEITIVLLVPNIVLSGENAINNVRHVTRDRVRRSHAYTDPLRQSTTATFVMCHSRLICQCHNVSSCVIMCNSRMPTMTWSIRTPALREERRFRENSSAAFSHQIIYPPPSRLSMDIIQGFQQNIIAKKSQPAPPPDNLSGKRWGSC